MSCAALLWKFYLEDDVERFRQLLATAASDKPQSQKGGGNRSHTGAVLGSPGVSLGSPPILTSKTRKTSAGTAGGPAHSSRAHHQALSRADVNSRDRHGLTVLHHAASSQAETAASFSYALLNHPFVDIYAQDQESGWTALHRSLYFGKVTIARAILARDLRDMLGHRSGSSVVGFGGLFKVKDRDGNSAFDVLNETTASRTLGHRNQIGLLQTDGESEDGSALGDVEAGSEDLNAVSSFRSIGGDEAFFWGSNKNLTLGLGNEDDRQYPERIVLHRPDHLLYRFYLEYQRDRPKSLVARDDNAGGLNFTTVSGSNNIPTLIRHRPLLVQDIALSKFHSAILTTDPESNLYICGFGPGGRLGTGDQTTRFSYVCVEGGGLAGKRVISVALGQDHTLAVSEYGEIFSWGLNSFGQLGYALPKVSSKNEEPTQTLPRQIFGPLKREFIIGCAASQIHSVVHTATSLFTFGKNEGQLGLVDADARSLDIQTIPRKVGASLFSTSIDAVSAINRATVCLLANHEVWVFSNFGYAKISFPLDGFSNYFLRSSVFTTRYDNLPNHISKITCGGDTICAMSRMGDVFTVEVSQKLEPGLTASSTTNPTKIRNALSTPQKIWSAKKREMAVRDVGVAQDGSIIICTEGAGSVWIRGMRTLLKGVKRLGSLESKTKAYKFSRVPGLTHIAAVRSNAFGAYAAVRKDSDVTKKQILVKPQSLWEDVSSLLSFRALEVAPEDAAAKPRHPYSCSTDLIHQAVLLSSDLEALAAKNFSRLADEEKATYNAEIGTSYSDIYIPIHLFMLVARSMPFLSELSNFQASGKGGMQDLFSLKMGENGRVQIIFEGLDFVTVFNLVLYIYQDRVVDVWHFIRHAPENAFRYRQIRTELMKVALKLEMQSLESSVRTMVNTPKSLATDFERAFVDQSFHQKGDAFVELSGSQMKVHTLLLCKRCPFFQGLFHGRAAGAWLASRRENMANDTDLIKIDLKHIDPSIFQLVLRHIYADTGEELFDNVTVPETEDFLDIVIDVMAVANELMLDRLSQACQKVLGRFVNTRNACQLLNSVAACSVTEFKDACLEYVCLNLETMLENHLLDELSEDLLLELDDVVCANQLACFPFVRSGRAELALHERHPELVQLVDEERHDKIKSLAIRIRMKDDDELRPTSSHKVKVGSWGALSSSPSHLKAHHKVAREEIRVPSSPLLAVQPQIADDFIFNIELGDGVNAGSHGKESGAASATPSEKLPIAWGAPPLLPPSSPLEDDTWYNSQGKTLHPVERRPRSPRYLAGEGNSIKSASPALGQPLGSLDPLPGQPFPNPAMANKKLATKELKSQTSSKYQSSLSLGLSSQSLDEEYNGPFGTKLTQRQRKKQQLEQARISSKERQDGRPERVKTPERQASPWQPARKGAKIPMKDVLSGDRQSPSSPTIDKVKPAAPLKVGPKDIAQQSQMSGQSQLTKSPVSTPQMSNIAKRSDSKPPNQALAAFPPRAVKSVQSIKNEAFQPAISLPLSDIISQQQTEQEKLRKAVEKRSLQDIQQEQEFEAWWDSESRKLREEEERARRNEARAARGATRGRARGRGRGRGKGKRSASMEA